jgi:peptidoglycan/xylan/chitin deacetylase (PgdA/CDA1 family)
MIKQQITRSIAGVMRPFVPVVCRAVVLYGHGVVHKLADPAVQSLHAEAVAFERLIRTLKRSFEFIRLDDLANGTDLPNNAVCLTFDDGYRNNLTVAAPILRSLDVPFAVYVNTGHLDSGTRLPTYVAKVALRYTELRSVHLPGLAEPLALPGRKHWREAYAVVVELLKTSPQERVVGIVEALHALLPDDRWAELDALFGSDAPMSWTEARELQALGVEIGGHCHDHAILHRGQGPIEIERQVATCRRRLLANGFQARHFAFPNGQAVDIAPAALQTVQAAGFVTAATTIPACLHRGRSLHLLPRVAIRDTAEATFCHMLAARTQSANLRRWQESLLRAAAQPPSAYRRAA